MFIKKRFIRFFLTVGILFTHAAYANWFQDIINAINAQGNITNSFLNAINSQQGAMLTAEQDIDSVMKEVKGYLTGNSGWGTYNLRDYQSYGTGADNWSKVLEMAARNGGTGDLGQIISKITNQFPVDLNVINKVITDSNSRAYYAAEAQTLIATRAASELDFDRVQEQIAYQKMLQGQIEKTKDIKSAMDLSNRIQVEGNLIQLALLRQLAMTNQQQALTSQAAMNAALINANFLKQ